MHRATNLDAFLQRLVVRWLLTLAWTMLDIYLMLSPGSNGSAASWTSKFFGGTETTDAIGHVILNAILLLLWCWSLSFYTDVLIRWVLFAGLAWAFVAELSQSFVPERGVSPLDVGANVLGVLLGLLAHRMLPRAWYRRLSLR